MQLRTARLCPTATTLTRTQQCPVCASEAFAFMTRLGPPPERPEEWFLYPSKSPSFFNR